jgi:hypothetical protein
MAGISTHVLDNFTGRPGVGMRIDFSMRDKDGNWKLVKTMTPMPTAAPTSRCWRPTRRPSASTSWRFTSPTTTSARRAA